MSGGPGPPLSRSFTQVGRILRIRHLRARTSSQPMPRQGRHGPPSRSFMQVGRIVSPASSSSNILPAHAASGTTRPTPFAFLHPAFATPDRNRFTFQDPLSRDPMALKKKRKLYHTVPSWVKPGAVYHIRIRCAASNERPLTTPDIAKAVLETVVFYHLYRKWYSRLFILMPDHLHALVSFPPNRRMSEIVRSWKGYNKRNNGIIWQENYFDHRIRNDAELDEKAAYIRNNPVAGNLCASPEDWPWILDIGNFEDWL